MSDRQFPLNTLRATMRRPWVRTGLLGLGFILVIAARQRVGDQYNTPYAQTAIILWLFGVALVIVSRWDWGQVAGGERRGGRGAEEQGAGGRWQATNPKSKIQNPKSARLVFVVAALTLAAFALRVINLESAPWLMSGDEASVGLEGVNFLTGYTTNPFITVWSSHPTFYFILQSWSLRLLGQNLLALRLTSAVAGTLTIPLLYVFARRFWGRGVGLAAAELLTGMAFHLHWSRLSLDPVYDPLFALVVLGALIEGMRRGDRRWFILAGVVFSLSLYFWGTRLLAVVIIVLGLYYLLTERRRFWSNLGHWLAFTAVGLAIDLPLFVQFYSHPDDFLARMNQLGVFQTGHVARAAEPVRFLAEQFTRSILAFNVYPDTSPFYHPGIPLLRPVMATLLVVGIGYALWRWRRPPEFALLMLFLGAVVFGGMLLVTPPQANHYVIALPAVAIFMALGLVNVGQYLAGIWGGQGSRGAEGQIANPKSKIQNPKSARWQVAGTHHLPPATCYLLLAVTLLLAADDAGWYFGRYSPSRVFGDLNTEAAYFLGNRLGEVEPGAKVYFFGAPRIFSDFPSLRFLAGHLEWYNVAEPLTGQPEFITTGDRSIFVFLPERVNEAEYVAEVCPGERPAAVPRYNGEVLYYWLEAAGNCRP